MDLDLNHIPGDEELGYESDQVTEVDNDKEPVVNEFTSTTEFIPIKGMIFETLEESQLFWEKYALANGFGTKIRTTTIKNGILRHRMYTCSKEGEKYKKERPVVSKPRADIRCHCPARMSVSLIKDTQRYRVVSFISDHNHILEDKRTTHLFRSHKSIDKVKASAIDLAHGVGLGPKKIHRLMSLEAGGSEKVGFTKEEIKSYLRSQRTKDVGVEELHSIQAYFAEQTRKNSTFFHDYQVDQDGLLTNFFWADSKMILDYEAFGDVVSFDTTFGTNKLIRPLTIFAGFNNHRQIVIFGLALLYNETALSFRWVMKTFLRCHKEKQPRLIYTDQEKAMAVAIKVVMNEIRHALCTWHLSENALTNLRGGLQENCSSFMVDFHKCMKNYGDVSEFEEKWQVLLNKYGPFENDSKKWIDKFYKKKEQWSLAYLKDVFLAGTRTTQMSESVNSSFMKDLEIGYLTMRKFFQGLNLFLKTTRDNELESDFKMRQTSPYLSVNNSPILRHAASIYTPKMFEHFQKQFDTKHGVRLSMYASINEAHERIAYQDELEYKVKFNPLDETISCSCFMYETHGYFCAHILRVFNISEINQIPERYIMKRWTREAKKELVADTFTTVELDAQELRNGICSQFNRLAYRIGSSTYFANGIRRLIEEGHKFIDRGEGAEANIENEDDGAQCNITSDHIFPGVTG